MTDFDGDDFDGDDLVAAILGETAASPPEPAAPATVPLSAIPPARSPDTSMHEPLTVAAATARTLSIDGQPRRSTLSEAQRALVGLLALVVVIVLIGAAAMAARGDSGGPVPCQGDGVADERGLFDGC